MTIAQSMTESEEPMTKTAELKFITDEDLLDRLSEADDSRHNLRGRYLYRDNPQTARSIVVNTDDGPTQSSASFDIDSASIVDLIHKALTESGYPLACVRCACQSGCLTLSGVVRRYYHAQIAINAVRRVLPRHRLDYQIEVVSAQE